MRSTSKNISWYTRITLLSTTAMCLPLAVMPAMAEGGVFTNGPPVTRTDATIETTADWDFGAYAIEGGTISLDAGSINTSGFRGIGIIAGRGSSITSSTNITTTGNKAHGAQAGDGGSPGDGAAIILTGGTVKTSGSDAFGLHAYDNGTISGTSTIITSGFNGFGAFAESDSAIDLTGGSISTTGANAFGLLANNDEATSGGRITANGTVITTDGDDAAGALAAAGGSIGLTDVAITTNGLRAYGAHAQAGSTITLDGGSIVTANETGRGTQDGDGSRAYALYAEGADADIQAKDLSIATLGQRAYGAYAIGGANIGLTDTNISTEGFMAFGVYASGPGSTLTTNNVNVTTTGDVGDGAWAYNHGIVNLNGGTLHVFGGANEDPGSLGAETGNGMTAVGDGTINANGVQIITEGDYSTGLLTGANVGGTETAGTINLVNSSVTVNGVGADVAEVNVNSVLNLEGSQLVSAKGVGILLHDNASVTLKNTMLSAAEESFVSQLSAGTHVQTITVGEGSTAVQNNGTLLRVERVAGAEGTVNVSLGAGSTTRGDIIEANADLAGAGGTDVTLEEGADWSGLMQGVRNFVSHQDSDVVFQDHAVILGDLHGEGTTFIFSPAGGSIGGDVELTDASSTTGGSIATPITVEGQVSVDRTSTLGGNWDIQGDLTSDGTITPGNSIGVVNVNGNLNLGANSVYTVEIDANGNSDRIDVGGVANLDGTVSVSPLGSVRLNNSYTILTAQGGFAGTAFDSAAFSQGYAFISPTLSYDANQVLLTVGRNDVAFASAAQTRNQRAAAGALDTLPLTSDLANAVALSTAEDASVVFDQLSGEVYASAKTVLIDDSRLVRDAVNDRIRAAFDGVATAAAPVLSYGPDGEKGLAPADTDLFAAWGTAFGSWNSIDGDGNAAGVDSSTGGFVTGLDGLVADNWRLGVMAGYSHTSFDVDGRSSSGDSDNYHLGVYGGTQWGKLAFRSGLAYTWHNVDTSRSAAFGGFSDRLNGDYDAGAVQAFGEVGYRIDTTVASFEPFANLAYVSLKTDGFTENGEAAALSVDGDTTDTTFTTLGIRASAPLNLGTTLATVRGTLGWKHAFGDITPLSTNSFAGGDAFTVAGVPIAEDSAVVEAGVDFTLTKAATLGIAYAGQFGSGSSSNGVNANLGVKF